MILHRRTLEALETRLHAELEAHRIQLQEIVAAAAKLTADGDAPGHIREQAERVLDESSEALADIERRLTPPVVVSCSVLFAE